MFLAHLSSSVILRMNSEDRDGEVSKSTELSDGARKRKSLKEKAKLSADS